MISEINGETAKKFEKSRERQLIFFLFLIDSGAVASFLINSSVHGRDSCTFQPVKIKINGVSSTSHTIRKISTKLKIDDVDSENFHDGEVCQAFYLICLLILMCSRKTLRFPSLRVRRLYKHFP